MSLATIICENMECTLLVIIAILSMAARICGNINVAVLKRTYGSQGNQHKYVNDRDPDSCFQTTTSTGTYELAVDLADNFNISSIVIIDGNACCGTRIANYTIEVKFSCKTLGLLTLSTCNRVCTGNFWSIPDNENHLISCDRCLGHTVIIKSNEPLYLCEVQIYGTPISSYPPAYQSEPTGGCVVTNAIKPSNQPTTTTSSPTEATSYGTSTIAETTNLTDETTAYVTTSASTYSTDESTPAVTSFTPTTNSFTDETTDAGSPTTKTHTTTHHQTPSTVSTSGRGSTSETVTSSSKKTAKPTGTSVTDSKDQTTSFKTSALTLDSERATTDNQKPLMNETHASNSTLPQKSVTSPTTISDESKKTTKTSDVTKASESNATGNWSVTPFMAYTNSTSSPTFNNSRWNTVTDPSFPSYTYDLPTDNPLCACGCQSSVHANISEIEAVLTKIRQNLTLDTTTLSSTRRQKTSAEDNRPSAVSVGMFGIVILTVFFVVLVIQDFVSAVYFIVVYLRSAMRQVEPI